MRSRLKAGCPHPADPPANTNGVETPTLSVMPTREPTASRFWPPPSHEGPKHREANPTRFAPLAPFAPSPEPPWPQSKEVGRKNHRKSQKDTVPIRRSRRTDTPPADDEPARQTLAERVGIGIGIGIGIEISRGRTGFDPDAPAQLRVPSRGSRPGGPADDSPARERWVQFPMNTQPRQGRQIPSTYTKKPPIASPAPENAPVKVVGDAKNRALNLKLRSSQVSNPS